MDSRVLKTSALTKRYDDTTVLDSVDLTVASGEVRALLGENGAGKSTLIKIVSGSVRATEGTFTVLGRELDAPTPQAAAEAGVATLHQELAIAPGLSVAENVFLGRPVASTVGVVRWKRLRSMARAVFDELGFDIDVTRDAGASTPIEQTMTALARALSQQAPLLILDEPTASLTHAEVNDLFAAVRRLQSHGTAILYVSHRLDEVFELADTYTILRDGKRVAEGDISATDIDRVITAMAGRRIDDVFPPKGGPTDKAVLSVRDLRSRGLHHASLDLHKGEIFGIAGLAGAGRSELIRTISGLQRSHSGSMSLDGKAFRPSSARAAQGRGVVLVPEERRHEGLIPDSTARNLNVTTIGRHVTACGLISTRRELAHAADQWDRYDIRGRGLGQDVLRLSGGNQQKVVLAKFLDLDPEVILLDEPTRGVDVSTKAQIYRLITARADEGAAVVVVSSELPELLGICHRISVMHQGRLSRTFDASTITEQELLAACYGRAA